MSEALTVSERIAACFGISAARALAIRPLYEAKLAVVHLEHSYDNGEHTIVLPADDAFLVTLYLVDVDHCDVRPDGARTPLKTYSRGSMCLISLRNGAAILVRGRFEALAFHIPSALFIELAEEAGEPRIDDLTTCRGIDDQVVRNIGGALIPMFDMPDEVRDTLLPHIGLALSAHLAHRYGRSPIQHLSGTGRLSPLQEKRIKAYIAANLSGGTPVDKIAEACGFSVDELCSGFLSTTGQSVSEWIASYRISRAQSQLSRTGETIARIAEECGFPDENELVATFTRVVGVNPAAWRSSNRH
ncbi:putative AraC family transcriptional regulator (plasmid) [Rhizobium leguminosarum]|uniref:Putative AraC family transcriptional regulator n=1 Tax=Rhizobium leguminosarum TaxID=384 RepID=A0A2K9ZHN6_RHILE|nr:AraC family transcriptional regulator [Rhizobium leguminosarum]AUW47744.1 putative AraC family transcriptional regulator [Rhizobium leguminosarum]